MNPRLMKFAPYGFYLSVLAALVSFGLIVIRQKFDLPLQISLGMILIGLALSILFDPERVRRILTGRQAKYSSNAFVLAIAVLGILAVVNYLVNNHSMRWDLTEDQQNTLSPETINIIKSLPENVTALAFFSPRFSSADAGRLLESYKYDSQGKFDYQFIDPDADPLAAKNAGVTRDGTIVLKMAGRQEQVTYSGEQEITSALVRLANPGSRVVYFLTGHGEFDLNGSTEKKITYLKTDLENKNYTVKPLNLLSTPKIPDDALALVVASPVQALAQSEVNQLKTFLDSGKSLVLMLEPQPLTNFNQSGDPFLEYLKSAWGVTFDDDFLVDPSVNPPLAAVANFYGDHPITQKMPNVVTLFPTARSLHVQPTSADITATDLIKTSQDSWGETDFSSIQGNQVAFNQATDLPGPLVVASAEENSQTKARVVLIGDADFAADGDFANYGNGVFIVNSIDWAARQDNLIQLTPRKNTQRMIIPPQQFTMGLVLFGSVFLMPVLILMTGIVVFVQRRRKA